MPNLRFPQSLRTRIMAFTGIIFLLLGVLIVLSIILFVVTNERDSWHARQSEAAQTAANVVADYLRTNENLLSWLDKYGFDEAKANPEILQAFLQDNPDFMEVIFLDKAGNLLLDAAKDESILANQFTILQSEWFRVALSGEKIYTRVQTSPQGESYLIFAMPSAHGRVVAAQIQMDALWQTVAGIRFGNSGSVYIVNAQGQVIAHPDRQIVLSNKNIRDTQQFQKILQAPGHNWYGNTVNFNGDRVTGVSTSIRLTDWIVITELPQTEAYASSRKALTLIPAGILCLMIIAILLFRYTLTRLIIQPVNLLRSGAQQLGQGNLSHRIDIPRMDELGEVIAVFNAMAAELQKQTEELERRVADRTTALSQANASLINEVSERTAAEEKVRASLQEKEVLLKEIHHRVKNNLQIVSSLLNLQTDQVRDTNTLRALHDSRARVRSMALIHEKLYQSQSLANIDFGEYVQSLTTELFHSYQRGFARVKLNVQVDSVALDLDHAVSCGLILNELMTNALKYAFPDGKQGTIWVELRNIPERKLSLRVADDGAGIPSDLDITKTKTLGLQLVHSLVAQLDGKLELERSHGTAFEVTFEYS